MRSMDSSSNGPVESTAESPSPAAEAEDVPRTSPAAAATKGRWLRRWRRIRRGQEQQREGHAAAVGSGGAGDEDSAQLHKRRLPLAAGAPKGKHGATAAEEESSTASVESRFIPPAKLDPALGLLVASSGFSVGAGGADSDNSEDRSSKSSTAASAPRVPPRHEHALLLQRERDRLTRTRAPAVSLHGRNPRALRSRGDRLRVAYSAAVSAEADNSRSSVESDLRSSNAVKARQLGAGLNGIHHKVFSDYRDLSDEEQPSEGVRSTGYSKENGSSVVGRSVQMSADSGDGVGNGQNGRMHSGADLCYESTLLLLQRTQEALENEIEKITAIGKEPTDDFDVDDDECSGLVHLKEPSEEVSGRIKNLESKLEEASALIKEKASRIHELETTRSQRQPRKTAIENSDLRLSQSELDQLYQEKMEAEIQCAILTRVFRASATLSEDQAALYKAQKSLSEDYKQLGLQLRHTENRAMALEEMAEKLQVQCKELSNCSEVMRLQSKACRVSLFCFVQFILLCIAIGTYLMQLSPSSTEVVPT